MAGQEHVTPAPANPAAVKSCWLCGIRLPAAQMMADGGAACADVRWYCRDRRGCTERWTAPRAKPAAAGAAAMPERRRGRQLA